MPSQKSLRLLMLVESTHQKTPRSSDMTQSRSICFDKEHKIHEINSH